MHLLNSMLLSQNQSSSIKKESFWLSSSKIQTYEECPLKFKFRYVLNIPTPDKTYFNLGNAIHAVAENMAKLQREGRHLTEEEALEILEGEWKSSLYIDKEEEESANKIKSREMIKLLLEWTEKNQNTIAGVEQWFKFRMNDVMISGRMDRVEETSDGDYEVIDFKTGLDRKSEETIKDDIQMNMYALGTKQKYGKLPKKVSLFYLEKNRMVTYVVEGERLEKFKEKLGDKIESIFNGEFNATPEQEKCSWCDFNQICDKKIW